MSLIIFFAYLLASINGFGATLIAVTLGAYLYDITYLVPVLIPLNVMLSAYITLRYRKTIDRHELFKRIVPLACLAMPLGFALFFLFSGSWLKRALGLFVLLYSIYELVQIFRGSDRGAPLRPLSTWKGAAWLLSGGLIQGMYATGGPMIVIYSSRVLSDKARFRSTLNGFWLVSNSLLVAAHSIGGTLNASTLRMSFAMVIPAAIGIVAGDWMHARIPERQFRMSLFAMLIFAALSLLVMG